MAGGYHVEVGGSVHGHLIVGDHNLVVNAESGSSVTFLQEARRPVPQRRPWVRVLPRRPDATFGRTAELAAIAAAVGARSSVQVHGPSGMGKSTLLRQSAHDLAADTGVVFVAAAGAHHLDVMQEIFEGCYDTAGYRPTQTELRRLMSGVRVCVVADDLDCTPDQLAAIGDVVPDAALLTSSTERRLWGDGRAIALTGLPADAAVSLARREFGRDLTERETAALMAQWTAVRGEPMALLRAAAALAVAPEAPPDPAAARLAVVTGLHPAERDALDLLLTLDRAPVSASLAAALAGGPADRVAAALDRLVDVGLADRVGDGYRAAGDPAGAVPAYRRGIGELTGATVDWIADPERRPREVAAHAAAIVALVDAAVRLGRAREGTRLARAAAPVVAVSLRWGAWQDVLTSGQAAALACDDKAAYAYFTHERGIRMLCLGQAAAAAVVLATAVGLWSAIGLSDSAAVASSALTAAGGAAPAAGAGAVPGGATPGGGGAAPAHSGAAPGGAPAHSGAAHGGGSGIPPTHGGVAPPHPGGTPAGRVVGSARRAKILIGGAVAVVVVAVAVPVAASLGHGGTAAKPGAGATVAGSPGSGGPVATTGPTVAVTLPDACTLVSTDEVASIVGADVLTQDPPVAGGSNECSWQGTDGPVSAHQRQIGVTVSVISATREQFENSLVPLPGSSAPAAVPGLGEAAYAEAGTGTVFAYQRGAMVQVQVVAASLDNLFGTELQQATTIAREVLGKLP